MLCWGEGLTLCRGIFWLQPSQVKGNWGQVSWCTCNREGS